LSAQEHAPDRHPGMIDDQPHRHRFTILPTFRTVRRNRDRASTTPGITAKTLTQHKRVFG
jgi:hypothetical protein